MLANVTWNKIIWFNKCVDGKAKGEWEIKGNKKAARQGGQYSSEQTEKGEKSILGTAKEVSSEERLK